MTPLIFLATLAASMPTTDPQKICLDARSAAAVEDRATAYQACVHDEVVARDQLRKNWGHFTANARETCAEPGAVAISYVEVLTCLEMESGLNFSGAAPVSPTTPPDAPNATGVKP